MTGLTKAVLTILAVCALLARPGPAMAADNSALGGIGGFNNGTLLGGDGTGTARFTLFSTNLALVKQARDLTGAVLPDGTDVSPGEEVWFVLYVDNSTPVDAADLRIDDPLSDLQFTYVQGTLGQTVVPSGSNDAAIWAGVWSPLTDAVGAPDDAGSATDNGGPPGEDRVTVGAVAGQVNQVIDVPAQSLRAVRFRVRVN